MRLKYTARGSAFLHIVYIAHSGEALYYTLANGLGFASYILDVQGEAWIFLPSSESYDAMTLCRERMSEAGGQVVSGTPCEAPCSRALLKYFYFTLHSSTSSIGFSEKRTQCRGVHSFLFYIKRSKNGAGV